MTPAALHALAEGLVTLEVGSVAMSRAVFLAVGGEFRAEPVSAQGGSYVTLPYWPGERHPTNGVSCTTNLQHVSRLIREREITHHLWWSPAAGWEAEVGASGYVRAATAELALCAALLRHMAATADAADKEAA